MMELDQKKKEIVQFFIKKNILIDADMLKRLENEENINKLYNLLSSKTNEELLIIGEEILQLLDKDLSDVNWKEFDKSKAVLEKKKDDKEYSRFMEHLEHEKSQARNPETRS